MTALTALDMRVNRLACNGQDWCPVSLAGLSRLALARFSCCGIDSLSPTICSLGNLASLDLHSNFLEVCVDGWAVGVFGYKLAYLANNIDLNTICGSTQSGWTYTGGSLESQRFSLV